MESDRDGNAFEVRRRPGVRSLGREAGFFLGRGGGVWPGPTQGGSGVTPFPRGMEWRIQKNRGQKARGGRGGGALADT